MDNVAASTASDDMLSYEGFRNEVLGDYRTAYESREFSVTEKK